MELDSDYDFDVEDEPKIDMPKIIVGGTELSLTGWSDYRHYINSITLPHSKRSYLTHNDIIESVFTESASIDTIKNLLRSIQSKSGINIPFTVTQNWNKHTLINPHVLRNIARSYSREDDMYEKVIAAAPEQKLIVLEKSDTPETWKQKVSEFEKKWLSYINLLEEYQSNIIQILITKEASCVTEKLSLS